MNSSFPNRWSFSYLKFTKYVSNIIAEPKNKYGQQEQVTVWNHNRVLIQSKKISNNQVVQGCTPEWRTNFQRETTTRDSNMVQSRNTVIRNPRILCTPFKVSGSTPASFTVRMRRSCVELVKTFGAPDIIHQCPHQLILPSVLMPSINH